MNPGHFSNGEIVGYFILFWIGLIGNLLVIFTLAGNSETLKRSANVYILNLTIADLLLIISIPNTIFVPQFKSRNQHVDKDSFRDFHNYMKFEEIRIISLCPREARDLL